MAADRFRFFHGANVRGADVAVAVCRDGHADSGGAGQDAEIVSAIGHIAGDEVRVVGVIHGLTRMRSEIMDFVTHFLKVGNYGVFEIDGAVIGSEGNAECGMAHGRAGIQDWEFQIGNRKFHRFSKWAILAACAVDLAEAKLSLSGCCFACSSDEKVDEEMARGGFDFMAQIL